MTRFYIIARIVVVVNVVHRVNSSAILDAFLPKRLLALWLLMNDIDDDDYNATLVLR